MIRREIVPIKLLFTVKIINLDYYRNMPYMPLHGSAARGFIVNKYASN